MIRFYDVDENYVSFLRQYDKQIPNIKYDTVNKFVCGVVLHINGVNYAAPVSHNTNVVKTSLPIYNPKRQIISTIRFSFMFPVKFNYITEKDFNAVAKTDINYANLLRTEYLYCKSHEAEILDKAKKVYKIGCNKKHYLNYTCCDFLKLESVYLNYSETELKMT